MQIPVTEISTSTVAWNEAYEMFMCLHDGEYGAEVVDDQDGVYVACQDCNGKDVTDEQYEIYIR